MERTPSSNQKVSHTEVDQVEVDGGPHVPEKENQEAVQ